MPARSILPVLALTEGIRIKSATLLEKGAFGMRFSELVRLLEQSGFRLIKNKGSIRYYGKLGVDRLIALIIMEPKKFPPEPAMLFLRPPA